MVSIDTSQNSANESSCMRYRYTLVRRFDVSNPTVLVYLMLNPSTANAKRDDPTIRRCIAFAKREDYGAMIVVNLYAYRATDPRELKVYASERGDITGSPLADVFIAEAVRGRDLVCAWGAYSSPTFKQRVREVRAIVEPASRSVLCFGKAKNGSPRHPLMLPNNAELTPYDWQGL